MYDPAGPPLSQELIRLIIGLIFSCDSQAFQKSIFLFSLLKSNRASQFKGAVVICTSHLINYETYSNVAKANS